MPRISRHPRKTSVKLRRASAFETASRQQSLEAAQLARDPNSDEHAVMRELEADLDDPI